jgi:hypothetical protein
MEQYPLGTWNINRPSIVSWLPSLYGLPSSEGLRIIADRVSTLGHRLDLLQRTTRQKEREQGRDDEESVQDEVGDDEDEEDAVDSKSREKRLMENPTAVSRKYPLFNVFNAYRFLV